MVDMRKTKAQLIKELEALRARVKSLEHSEDIHDPSSEYLRTVAENAPVGIGLHRNGIALYVNPAYAHMFGYDDDTELIGRHFTHLVAPQCREELADRNRRRELGEDVLTSYEATGLRKDGTQFPFHVQVVHLELPEGGTTVGFFTDITERQQHEDALRGERDRAQQYLDLAGVMFVAIGADQKVNLINKKGCEILECAETDAIGENWFDTFIPPRFRDEVRIVFTRMMSSEVEPIEYFENSVLTCNGTERIIAWHNTLLRDRAGNIAGTLSAGEDITERKQAEEALRESEERSRIVSELTTDYVFIVDIDRQGALKLRWASDNMMRVTGRTFSDVQTIDTWKDIIVPEDQDKFFQFIHQIITTRQQGEIECRSFRGNGSVHWLHIVVSPKTGEGGNLKIVGAVKDITDRKRAEEALRESETIFSSFLEHSPVYVFFKDKDIRALRLSRNYEQMLGMPLQQLLGKTMDELFPSDLSKSMVADDMRVLSEGQRVEVVEEFNGRIYETIKFPILKDGKPHMLAGFTVDVTERKHTEEALRVSEEKFRSIVEITSEWIWQLDVHGRHMYSNPAIEKILGYTPSEIVGGQAIALLTPESQREVEARLPQLIHDKQGWTGWVLGWQHKDGTVRWLESNATPILGADGRLLCYRGADRDITERRRAEEALHHEHALLERITQTTPMVILVLNRQGHIMYANSQAERVMGLSRTEITGLTYNAPEWDVTDEDGADLPDQVRTFQQVMSTGQAVYDIRRTVGLADGKHHLSVNAAPLHDETGEIEGVITTISDVTSIVQAQKAQEQYVKRLETLHEIDQAILLAETPQAIAEAALGHLRELIPCQRASVAVFDFEHDDVEILASQVSGKTQVGAGLRVPVKKYGIDEEMLRGRIMIIDDLAARPHLSGIGQILLSEGIHSIINVPLVVQGEPIGALNLGSAEPASFTDEHIEIAREVADQLAITIQHARLRERDQHHREELEQHVSERTAELRVAYERLQALSRVKDEFVSNVSHELRSPIASTKTYLHLLAEHPEKREKYIETLRREIDRLEHLIESLLILSRLDQDRVTKNLTNVNLNNLIGEYVIDRTPLAESKNLTLMFEPLAKIPTVTGDRQLIGEVLSILLTNAFNYTSAGGQVTINTQSQEAADGAWVGFSISDSGWGISPEEMPLLFERFYRGKAALETKIAGTGLGLAIAREIIELHCGRIEVHSDGIPGRGTTFHVWLPIDG